MVHFKLGLFISKGYILGWKIGAPFYHIRSKLSSFCHVGSIWALFTRSGPKNFSTIWSNLWWQHDIYTVNKRDPAISSPLILIKKLIQKLYRTSVFLLSEHSLSRYEVPSWLHHWDFQHLTTLYPLFNHHAHLATLFLYLDCLILN